MGSFTEIQRVEKTPVGALVVALEVFEESAAVAHQLQQTLAGGEIFLVRLEMRRELIDAGAQERDLHLRRTGVFLVLPELLDDGFGGGCKTHGIRV